MADKSYVGTIGLEIVVDCRTDLTSLNITSMSLKVKKPQSEKEVEWEAAVVDDTCLRYITRNGDLDEAGTYKIQPHLVIDDTFFDGSGKTVELNIYDKYQ